jgi:hypothetical protein
VKAERLAVSVDGSAATFRSFKRQPFIDPLGKGDPIRRNMLAYFA